MILPHELSHPSLSRQPSQTREAYAEITLVVTGIVLMVLAAVATALLLLGLLSISPACTIYAFPVIGLFGLILVSFGSGLLIKRNREVREKELTDLRDRQKVLNIQDLRTEAMNLYQNIQNLDQDKNVKTNNSRNLITIFSDRYSTLITNCHSCWKIEVLVPGNYGTIKNQLTELVKDLRKHYESSHRREN